MRPTRLDVIAFVYTLGAVVTGGLLAGQVGITDRFLLLGVSIVASIAWTIYFRVTMLPRLRDELVDDDDEEEPSEAMPTVERTSGE